MSGKRDGVKGPTHNPEPPKPITPQNTNAELCGFYRKVGACRFGDRCSRVHIRPVISKTLLIIGMYNHPSLDNLYGGGKDSDISLVYEEADF